MTKLWRIAWAVLLTIFVSGMPANAGAGKFEYISPAPASSLASLGSTIAFRTGRTFEKGNIPAGLTVTVKGLASGWHGGNIVLSDDRRTVLFCPDIPFRPAETVMVSLSSPSASGDGSERDSIAYSFTTAPEKDPEPAAWTPPGEPGGRITGSSRVQFSRRESLVPDTLPGGFPSIAVIADSGAPPLSIFLSNFPFDQHIQHTPYLMSIAADASPRFARRMPEDCFDFKRQPNGLYTYYEMVVGCFFALDSTFTVVDSFKCGNGYPTDNHELRLLPGGHALILGYDLEPVRMDTIVQGGDSTALAYGLILQELDASKNVVFEWRSWDHFRITDAIGVDLKAHMIDYVHGNAIELDADSNIILSSRHLSEITKINRQTGEIIWRWGGKNNQFAFRGDTAGFSYQHMIRRLQGGPWTMFDNGNFHSPQFSRALEYVLDEQQKTATLVWQYRHTPDVFGSAMGSVQRMEDGNTLIGWGATNPSVSLVDPGGRTLLELSLPQGVYSYRAFGIAASPLTSVGPGPQAVIRSPVLAQNFPNPFNPSTTITYWLSERQEVSLVVYNILGQEVKSLVRGMQPAGSHEVRWDGSDDRGKGTGSGVYIYRLNVGSSVQSKKLIMLR